MMEKIKDLFEKTLSEDKTYFTVGDQIKFVQGDVSPYNLNIEIGFDYGNIVGLSGSDYNVKLDNGNTIKVKNQHAYAFGNADAS